MARRVRTPFASEKSEAIAGFFTGPNAARALRFLAQKFKSTEHLAG